MGIALVALLALTGCNEILVNVQDPGATSGPFTTTYPASSAATIQVVPTSTLVSGQRVAALDVQFTSCDVIKFTNIPSDYPGDAFGPQTLRHDADVVDGNGVDITPFLHSQIEGFSVTEDQDPSKADHVIVPIAGHPGPYVVQGSCTTAGADGPFDVPSVTYLPASCTTVDDACPLTRGGGSVQYFWGA